MDEESCEVQQDEADSEESMLVISTPESQKKLTENRQEESSSDVIVEDTLEKSNSEKALPSKENIEQEVQAGDHNDTVQASDHSETVQASDHSETVQPTDCNMTSIAQDHCYGPLVNPQHTNLNSQELFSPQASHSEDSAMLTCISKDAESVYELLKGNSRGETKKGTVLQNNVQAEASNRQTGLDKSIVTETDIIEKVQEGAPMEEDKVDQSMQADVCQVIRLLSELSHEDRQQKLEKEECAALFKAWADFLMAYSNTHHK